MGSYDRVDFYRKNRDYAGLLDEDGGAEELEEEPEEYEDDNDEGLEQGRKSESDEDPEVARERQEYLERRAKLKELERQKLKRKLNGVYGWKNDSDSESDKKKLPYDNYGSFFGPSQPVVARRVIEETRARLEAAQVVARIAKEVPEKSYTTASYTRHEDNEPPRPKVGVNETKKKAQQLKAARDYSFLFSEDGEIPGTETHIDKPFRPDNAQQRQTITKHSKLLKKPILSTKQIPSVRDAKGIVKPSRQNPVKVGTQTKAPSAKPRPLNDPRKELNKVGSELGRSAIQGNGSVQRIVNNGTRVGGVDGNKKKAPPVISSKVGKSELQRTTISHPTSMQKPVSSKAPVQKPQTEQRKPSVLAKPATKLANKFEARSAARPPPKPTPNLPPKPQARPSKPPMSQNLHDERPKKRHRDDDFEDCTDGGNYRSLIREMFGYNPNKYRDIDEDDDRAMEVGFSAIQNEERRSARIAREEDERELALIEAEEREEKLKAKKCKLQRK